MFELVEGANLADILFDDSTNILLTPRLKISIARETACALSYLHWRKPVIIHQDLKPGNILINRNTGQAKLCDFGLGRIRTLAPSVREVGIEDDPVKEIAAKMQSRVMPSVVTRLNKNKDDIKVSYCIQRCCLYEPAERAMAAEIANYLYN